jgi:hypothetical protein
VNIVILDWQRPLWEEDQEVAKRSGRDEPMWVAIHKCMEATPGISLYGCLCLKLAKMLCLSYYLSCFLFNNIKEQEVIWMEGGGPNNVYTREKCKNNTIK